MQLFISLGLIASVVIWGLVSPATLDTFFSTALATTTRNFGWFSLWLVLGLVVLAFFLAFSRYGDLKLGAEDDEPEFSVGTWFAMLFAAGMGIGLVFWGVAEPISHYTNPPPGVLPGTPEAASAAMRYGFFHLGVHPWAIYGIVGLAIAFFSFRRNASPLVSSVTAALPWRAARRMSPAFNVLALVATAFGVAASLGMGATQINSGLHTTFGAPAGLPAQSIIIVVATLGFVTSAVSGLGRGVKWLSLGNLCLAAALALFVFVAGPTVAIVDTLTNTLGVYITDFVRMSLRTSPFRHNSWVSDWTIFYWAWWLACRPSWDFSSPASRAAGPSGSSSSGPSWRPRWPALMVCCLRRCCLNFEIFQGIPLTAAVKADVSTVLFVMLDAMPGGGILSAIATLLVFVFFVT